jgi:hypothetical protein
MGIIKLTNIRTFSYHGCLEEEAKIQKELIAFLKEMQKSGTGTTLLAKTIRESFPGYFDKNGKPCTVVCCILLSDMLPHVNGPGSCQ